jgi:hypothetical protein
METARVCGACAKPLAAEEPFERCPDRILETLGPRA